MLKTRVFPCLLLRGAGLVKTVHFKNPTYVGDPINAVRIFNTKEVDELVLLDITATEEKRRPNFSLIAKIANECMMPMTVGGGIKTLEDVKELLAIGVEKVVINTMAMKNPDFIEELANTIGSQAVVVSIDAKKKIIQGYEVMVRGGKKSTGINPVDFARQMEERGAGEIFLNSIDQDGTMFGYDIPLVKKVSEAIRIPLIACGGCGKVEDFNRAVCEGGASAVAAGSFFVFHGPRRAVLINFPTRSELEFALNEKAR